MSIRPHTFFYYLLILMTLLIQPVRSQGILGMASGGMVNNPIVSGELGGMQAGLSGAFFGFVVEKAAEAAGADVTFQFQGARAWFSLADLFRTTEQEQNLMKGILQLEVDTQSQTLTGSVITPEPSATMPGVIIYPSTPVPEYSPATSDIPLVDWSPILSRINSAILNLIKTVLQFGERTDTAEVQCRTRYSASNTPIPEPTSTPDPAAALKEDERICEGFENDPFPESFGLYSTDEKNGDLTVEVHNAIGDVLAINPSSTTSSGYQIATLKYQPRQVPGGSSSAVSQPDVTQSSQACSESMETQSITETLTPEEPRPSKRQKIELDQDQQMREPACQQEQKRIEWEKGCLLRIEGSQENGHCLCQHPDIGCLVKATRVYQYRKLLDQNPNIKQGEITSLNGMKLSGNIVNINFSNINLEGSEFDSCNFTSCNFEGVDFTKVGITDSKFLNCKFGNNVKLNRENVKEMTFSFYPHPTPDILDLQDKIRFFDKGDEAEKLELIYKAGLLEHKCYFPSDISKYYLQKVNTKNIPFLDKKLLQVCVEHHRLYPELKKECSEELLTPYSLAMILCSCENEETKLKERIVDSICDEIKKYRIYRHDKKFISLPHIRQLIDFGCSLGYGDKLHQQCQRDKLYHGAMDIEDWREAPKFNRYGSNSPQLCCELTPTERNEGGVTVGPDTPELAPGSGFMNK